MEKFLNLTDEQFQDLDESTDAICEENEKFPGNALFFLINAYMSTHNNVMMCEKVLANKKFSKDHDLFCGLNLYFDLVNIIRNRDLIPEKREEVLQLYNVALKAGKLYGYFIDRSYGKVTANLKVQDYLRDKYLGLIKYIVQRDGLLEAFNKLDADKHVPFARFVMNTGKYSDETTQYFLENFVHGTPLAA